MKPFVAEFYGDLAVTWKDCYQHPNRQFLAKVKPGDNIVILSEKELQQVKEMLK